MLAITYCFSRRSLIRQSSHSHILGRGRRLAGLNGETIEARNFFSLFSGNNLNSRRDDEKLFPRLVLESAAYYYQVQRGLRISVNLSFFPLDDLYRFGRHEERLKRDATATREKCCRERESN